MKIIVSLILGLIGIVQFSEASFVKIDSVQITKHSDSTTNCSGAGSDCNRK